MVEMVEMTAQVASIMLMLMLMLMSKARAERRHQGGEEELVYY